MRFYLIKLVLFFWPDLMEIAKLERKRALQYRSFVKYELPNMAEAFDKTTAELNELAPMFKSRYLTLDETLAKKDEEQSDNYSHR